MARCVRFLLLVLGATGFLEPARSPAQAGRGVLDPLTAVVDRGRFTRTFGVRTASGLDTSWEVWWELNKDQYLGLTRRGKPARTEERGEVFLGRRTRGAPASPPFGADERRIKVIEALHESLHDRREAVRASAAYALGMLGKFCPGRCLPRLIATLKDRSTRVKDVAIIALGLTESDRAFPALLELFKGSRQGARLLAMGKVNNHRRALAALGLGLTRKAEALDVLARAAVATRLNRDVRGASILALGLLRSPRAMPALNTLIHGPRTQIQLRALAVTSLGRLGCEGCLKTLRALRNHPNVEIRRAAVLALGVLRPMTPAVDRLEEARQRLAAEGDPEERKRLENLVATLEKPAAAELARVRRFRTEAREWLARAAAEEVFEIRMLATVALGQVGGEEEMAPLGELLFDANQEIRNFAALGVGLLGRRGQDPGGWGYNTLVRAFKKERRLDKVAAIAIALGLYGKPDAAPLIRKRLRRRDDPLLRSYLALALGMLGDREGEKKIINTLLRARNADELQNAAEAFLLIQPSAGAVNGLRDLLAKSKDRYKQVGAGVGLAFLGDPRDLESLCSFARNVRNPQDARAFVIEGLGVAGNVRDPDPLARLAAGHDYFVASEAVDAALALKW